MSINNRRINETAEEAAIKVEIFSGSGRFDQAATDAANAEIFNPTTVVRVAGSTAIDKAATLAAQKVVAAAVRTRLK